MTGYVTISIEIELGWGMHDKERYNHLSPNATAELNTLSRLLNLCDEYKIPITFDIVGHLLLETCNGSHRGPYPKDWWSEDPGANYIEDPLFYSPDLVNMITNSKVKHEIATHTFSHILCEDTADELLDHELTQVNRLHRKTELPSPNSIVTPRHQQPSYEILNKHDIKIIRSKIPRYYPPNWAIRLKSAGSLFWILSRKHPITHLDSTNGITKTYCTPHPSLTSQTLPEGQRLPHPVYRSIPQKLRQKRHIRYLKSAIIRASRKEKHVHFWTHLFNMSNEPQFSMIQHIFKTLSENKENGDVVIKKMQELPDIDIIK